VLVLVLAGDLGGVGAGVGQVAGVGGDGVNAVVVEHHLRREGGGASEQGEEREEAHCCCWCGCGGWEIGEWWGI
jgi:hypothetical protein